MSGRDELVERIARAIAGTRGHDWAALDGSYGGRVVRVQIMREVDALLPIINAEIAAAVERSAGVAEEYPSLEHADIAVVRGIAAAIRAGAK